MGPASCPRPHADPRPRAIARSARGVSSVCSAASRGAARRGEASGRRSPAARWQQGARPVRMMDGQPPRLAAARGPDRATASVMWACSRALCRVADGRACVGWGACCTLAELPLTPPRARGTPTPRPARRSHPSNHPSIHRLLPPGRDRLRSSAASSPRAHLRRCEGRRAHRRLKLAGRCPRSQAGRDRADGRDDDRTARCARRLSAVGIRRAAGLSPGCSARRVSAAEAWPAVMGPHRGGPDCAAQQA
eukprot:scaffold2539_cov388-Prasinococcus_capsulatus_cf.AAC.12